MGLVGQLRESIDSLRRERQSFDNIYKKLDKDLTEKKKEMQRIIDLSNAAYEVHPYCWSSLQGYLAHKKTPTP